MQISMLSDEKEFRAELEYAILDEVGVLIAASFVGLNSAVNAIQAGVIFGGDGIITDYTGEEVYAFRPRPGHYRRLEYSHGNSVTHGTVLDKDAVYSTKADNPVIIAPEGDIEKQIGHYMTVRFSLPVEWQDKYYWLVKDRVKELRVFLNDNYTPWNSLRAVRLINVSQEYVEKTLEDALTENELEIPPSNIKGTFDPDWTTKEYTEANAPILAEQVNNIKAMFTPGRDNISPYIASMNRIPFPAQAYCIQGIVNVLKHRESAFVAGDMGTGKSEIANGIIHVLHKEKKAKRVLITAPGMTIPKWAEEIQETIPYAKVRTINYTKDAIRLVEEYERNKKPRHLEIVLLSIDRAKLGPEPYFAGLWKLVTGGKYYAWHCPDCYRPLPAEKELSDLKERLQKDTDARPFIHAQWDEFVNEPLIPPDEANKEDSLISVPIGSNGVPQGYVKKWDKNRYKNCPYCGTRIWRPALKSRGETRIAPRWYACRILKNTGKIFDIFFCDEIHQTKAGDSGRGYAFAQLVKCSKKMIGLTGTLTTGKASSIKEILWRSDPGSLIADGFDHKTGTISWASRYGVLERVMEKEEKGGEDEGIITVKKGNKSQLKELPGISPELTAKYLLDRTVFLELGDLGLPLVELKEHPVFIEMDEDHKMEYTELHESLYEECKKAMRAGNSGAFSVFVPTTINYADRPDLGAYAEVGGEMFIAPEFSPEYFHAKERKLVEIVENELSEDRGTVIYTKYSHYYQINQRLKKVLNDHGITCTILPASVGTDQRMEWLKNEEQKGTKVIICNLELVETGLDLLPWPTVIFYQMDYRVNDIRQSSRRSWRIGQTRQTRVWYLVYDSTQQMAQFKHVMAGRGHALFVEGRLDRSELAKYAIDENTSMAYDITKCLAESDLATRWQELAQKDMDQNLEIVEEEKFKQTLENAKRELVTQTLQLCGIKDAEQIQTTEHIEQAGEQELDVEVEILDEKADEEIVSDLTSLTEKPTKTPSLFDFSTDTNVIDIENRQDIKQKSNKKSKSSKKRSKRTRKKKTRPPEQELSLVDFWA